MENNNVSDNITLKHLTLGKQVEYSQQYDPSLLQAVPRSLNRDELPLEKVASFYGSDLWNGYELSWLNNKGKPQVAILQVIIPCDSPNLVESKSFKLYLNSFNGSQFANENEINQTITKDLTECAGQPVAVTIILPKDFDSLATVTDKGHCIDDLDIEVNAYQPDAALLNSGGEIVTEHLHSHLLKSNCLITNQPDWATVEIHYTGAKIDHAALLKYLISFRDHNEFHEQCVERIYCDILLYCKPQTLTVHAKYTRRGGLDINPVRSTEDNTFCYKRHCRQ